MRLTTIICVPWYAIPKHSAGETLACGFWGAFPVSPSRARRRIGLCLCHTSQHQTRTRTRFAGGSLSLPPLTLNGRSPIYHTVENDVSAPILNMLVRTRYRFRATPQRLGWVDPPSKLFPTCGLLAGAERWGYQADPACNGRLTPPQVPVCLWLRSSRLQPALSARGRRLRRRGPLDNLVKLCKWETGNPSRHLSDRSSHPLRVLQESWGGSMTGRQLVAVGCVRGECFNLSSTLESFPHAMNEQVAPMDTPWMGRLDLQRPPIRKRLAPPSCASSGAPGVHRPLAVWLPPPASPIDSGCTACRRSVLRALVPGPPSIPRAPYT